MQNVPNQTGTVSAMRRKLDLALYLLLTAFLSSGLLSCVQRPASASALEPAPTPAPVEADQSFLPPINFEADYGITVTAKALCVEGAETVLYLETILDAGLWRLSEKDLRPFGETYFETSILFLENDQLFSNVSSGYRAEPTFDFQTGMVSTLQTFAFPKAASPNAVFTIKAYVTLLDLPAAYAPPVPMDFLEPGIIEIPMEYIASAVVGKCQ